MVFDIFLIGIIIVLAISLHKTKVQLEKLTRSNGSENGPEEFSLGLAKLNNEFSGEILLDPLTKLPGREAFLDRLQQALFQSKRFKKSFAVILQDINEFNVINKAQGYEVGDKLLIEVSKRLQNAIRQIDTVTRFAGDTFIFLLPELAKPETAAYVAQRVLDCVIEPFNIDGKEIFITSSVGVAIFPNDGTETKTLLKNAAEALAQAKIQGKGRYQFYRQEMHALGQRELSVSAMLRNPDILQKISVHYQPIVNTRTGEIVCIHATPHLEHPEYGSLPFLTFAKIAENCGKSIEIADFVFRNAITQFYKWTKEGMKFDTLSLDVNLFQIRNPQFIYNASKILQEFGLKPSQIIFEITEENVFSNTSSLEGAFEMLNQTGIHIAISIIALGHFALQKITKLPISYLKVDAKLFQEKKANNENEAIIHMIISLAKDMQINIIADSVDNEVQKDLLTDLGCEMMQGKLFGSSMPVSSAP